MDDLIGESDPGTDYRNLATALRAASVLLASGASTEDVEVAMRRIALAAGLRQVQAAVTMGILTISAVRAIDAQPITQLRIVGRKTLDYQRLAVVADLVDRLDGGRLPLVDAPAELDRIDRLGTRYSPRQMTLATAASSAAATVLFGGGALGAAATLLIGLAVDPIVRRIQRSGYPDFFQAVVGPLLATAIAIALVAAGLPIDAGLVVTGGILRFLPGAAFVAGMRDLIDGSIISGSARLAEALLLGSGVAVGTAIAIRLGSALGGPTLSIEALGASAAGVVSQAIAAGLACAFFGMSLGVRVRELVAVFLIGGAAWATFVLTATPDAGPFVPVTVAAILVGVVGQILASHARIPSVIWTVPAILPLLPGLTIVRGILGIGTLDGLLTVTSAIGTGFALGAGVAIGGIAVTTGRRARDVAQTMALPTLDDVRAGRWGVGHPPDAVERTPTVPPGGDEGSRPEP